MPAELGTVTQVYESSDPSAAGPFLVLIQDAHLNYDAQKNLAAILDQLSEQHGLQLVLVEGGSGDVSLTQLRRGPKAIRMKVADQNLKTGLMTGEEYFNMVADRPSQLWGVEDPELYDRNFSAFLEVEAVRSRVRSQLTQLRKRVDELIPAVYNKPLQESLALEVSFGTGNYPLQDYVRDLARFGEGTGVDAAAYPEFARYSEIRRLESSVNLQLIAADQRNAVQEIRGRGSDSALAHLIETAKQLKALQVAPEVFYAELAEVMARSGVDAQTFPELQRYFRLLNLKKALNVTRLLDDLNRYTSALCSALATTPDERALLLIHRGLRADERLIELKWTHADRVAAQESQETWRIKNWIPQLNALSSAHQMESLPADLDGAALDGEMDRCRVFYEVAQERDAAMAGNVLEKIRESGSRIAVLVVGGFHTDAMSRRFAEAGLEVVVVTPKVGVVADDGRYERMLKFKQQHREEKS